MYMHVYFGSFLQWNVIRLGKLVVGITDQYVKTNILKFEITTLKYCNRNGPKNADIRSNFPSSTSKPSLSTHSSSPPSNSNSLRNSLLSRLSAKRKQVSASLRKNAPTTSSSIAIKINNNDDMYVKITIHYALN